MTMTIRGIIFGLAAHTIAKQNSHKSRKGVEIDYIINLAQKECRIDPKKAEAAIDWLNDEGYIRKYTQSIAISTAGWELSERYIKALKKWYKDRKASRK